MRDQCSFAAFSACSCPQDQCESAAVPIIHLTERHDARRATDALIELAVIRASAIAVFGIAVLSLVFVGAPESQRLAKVNQENISHVVSR